MRNIDRRKLMLAAGAAAAALGCPFARRGETRERVRRLGVLMSSPATDMDAQARVAALQSGLRELGWVEDHNLLLEYRWAPGDPASLSARSRELVALAPDLILANSTPAALALKDIGTRIPVVFTQATD